MIPFPQKLVQANILVHTAFLEGVESFKAGIDLVWEFKTTTVMAPGRKEVAFGFLAEMPLFREWIGDRKADSLAMRSHSVTVKDFERTVKVSRDDIKYDNVGFMAPMIASYGAAAARFPSDLINDFQNAGTSKTCFDGQPFYDASHPKGLDGTGATFANTFTSSPLTPSNLWTQYEVMTALSDANGKRFGVRPTVLEYGPGLGKQVRDCLESEIMGLAVSSGGVFGGTSSVVGAAGVSNPARGLLTPMYNPDLTAGTWYLHDTRVMKPFMYVVETPPTGLVTRDRPDDPSVWNNKEFLYGAEATAAATCTLPHISQRNAV